MIRWIKLFLLAGILFISLSAVAAEFKPFKMVFLPDACLSDDNLVILQDVIVNINKKEDIDFVVFGGNNVNKSSDMPMFLDTISYLKAQYYAILGDHEAESKEEFIKEFEEFKDQTFWSAEPFDNLLLIGLDTSITGQQEGYLSIQQLFWLDTILKNNPGKFTIITMHHSPYSSLEKPEMFFELIKRYPQVKLVLSGHDLTTNVKKDNGKLFVNCPSIVTYPNEYKILKIYPDRIEIDTKKISFKQIIKQARKSLGKNYKKPDKFSRKNLYYYN